MFLNLDSRKPLERHPAIKVNQDNPTALGGGRAGSPIAPPQPSDLAEARMQWGLHGLERPVGLPLAPEVPPRELGVYGRRNPQASVARL